MALGRRKLSGSGMRVFGRVTSTIDLSGKNRCSLINSDGDCIFSFFEGGKNGDKLADGNVVSITDNGFIELHFRSVDNCNSFNVTDSCNSNCIMCSQPPLAGDSRYTTDEFRSAVELINVVPDSIGISGGEPSLLGEQLIEFISILQAKFDSATIFVLSNGRNFCDHSFAKQLCLIDRQRLTFSVPLHGDNEIDHDYITNCPGSFHETIEGLYNLYRYSVGVEIRVVLSRRTIDRLPNMVEFVYRNIPFVSCIIMMDMENMGYAIKNWSRIWVDIADEVNVLELAVRMCLERNITPLIYNVQRCLVPEGIQKFAYKSIDEHKVRYLEICNNCDEKELCCGFFRSNLIRHSDKVAPIKRNQEPDSLNIKMERV